MYKKREITNKKIVGFDLDGVIINHAPNKIKIAKSLGWELKPEETPSEIIRRILPRLTLEQLENDLYSNEAVSLISPIMCGAIKSIAHVSGKFPYFLISRRRAPQVAIKCLRSKGLWPKYFNEKNAFFVSKIEDKNIKAAELGITHYIDNEARVLENMPDVKNKILFDNLDVFSHIKDYPRVKSWAQLMKLLTEDKS